MSDYEIIKIKEHNNLLDSVATWFHEKWGIPKEAYVESMEKSLKNDAVP